ncbi:MAG: PilX N-terminal domain-containing pilus assembly protein [Lysobacterales bacterium]
MQTIVTHCPRTATPPFKGRRSQQGAALFVALMLLLIMTLLGLAAMQVTLLQERMSGNYRTLNLAFQNAEGQVRTSETQFERAFASGTALSADSESCVPFDVDAWAKPAVMPVAGLVYTRRMDKCIVGYGSRRVGLKENESSSNLYQINGIDFDRAADNSSLVVVETVFIP